MKRLIIGLLAMIFLALNVGFAESGSISDAELFDLAIIQLRQTDSRESVEEAREMFDGITSNYNQAKSFAMYSAAILDIYDGAYDDAETRIVVLEMNGAFAGLVKDNGLQSVDTLREYIQAKQLEQAGDVAGALKLYSGMSFMDSLEQTMALIPRVYDAAMKYYIDGKYEQAADTFAVLGNYKDSAEMAGKARALIPTPTPEPTPTPVPTPTPEPTPTPTPLPTLQTGEISDSWEEIIAAIDDGSAKLRYAIGATKELDLGELGIIHMQLAGFEFDERADGNGKAATTWIAKELLPDKHVMVEQLSDIGEGGWEKTALRAYLHNTVISCLPDSVMRRLVCVEKEYVIAKPDPPYCSFESAYSYDIIWIPGISEMIYDSALYYELYKDQVDWSGLHKSLIKTRSGNPEMWYTRDETWTDEYYGISSIGHIDTAYPDEEYGVAIGFCL